MVNGAVANAAGGIGDFASAIGDGSTATANNNSGDIATVYGIDSTALAGGTSTALASNYDFAEIFGSSDIADAGSNAAIFADMLNANATGANYLVEILPSLF